MTLIADVFHRPGAYFTIDNCVGELVKSFRAQGTRYFFIKEGDTVIDVIADYEILGLHPNRLVMDIKTEKKIRINMTTPVGEALSILNGRENAVVINAEKKIVGVVSRYDIQSYAKVKKDASCNNEKSNHIHAGKQVVNRGSADIEKMIKEFPELALTLIGRSKSINEVRKKIYMVKDSDAPVLITGETGTGKQLAANIIHSIGRRKSEPFIIVNCASFQESLFESEFFGYEKGAFTGAVQMKKGLVEAAEKGTLFIDEVGEMNSSVQAKLLHVIENGIYRRLGGIKAKRADIQIIAATNRNLKEMVVTKNFREDLFYRLNVINIEIPPLRQRVEDIPVLISYFLSSAKFQKNGSKQAGTDFSDALISYEWPGNVRELENVLWRAVLLAGNSEVLTGEHLPLEFGHSENSIAAEDCSASLKSRESLHIESVLKRVNGNKTHAAELLGISRSTLRRKLADFKAHL